MKKLLLVAMILIATASFAQMRNDLSAGKKTDLVAFNSAQDSVAYICLGETTPFDSYVRVYMYVIARSNTPDGENVLAATGMGGVGRYIKVNQPQADWNQSTTTAIDYIKNKPSIPSAVTPVYNYNVTRSVNSTSFTPSTTRPYRVHYNITISCTATIGSNASGKVELQYFNGTSWASVNEIQNSNAVTVVVAINSVNTQTVSVIGEFAANTQLRLVPTTTGTTAITYVRGTEILN